MMSDALPLLCSQLPLPLLSVKLEASLGGYFARLAVSICMKSMGRENWGSWGAAHDLIVKTGQEVKSKPITPTLQVVPPVARMAPHSNGTFAWTLSVGNVLKALSIVGMKQAN